MALAVPSQAKSSLGLPFKEGAQNFHATGVEAGKLCSHSFFDTTLSIYGTDETLVVPVQTCTTIGELQDALGTKLGYLEGSQLRFYVKQGCSVKQMLITDQVQHRMMVKGVSTFGLQSQKFEHPMCIIGAGYYGLKTAMCAAKMGQDNYVIFDRYDRVGGHCWLEMANKTTRLQTEFPTYHLWYGPEWSMPGIKQCGGPPTKWEIWPTAERLLEHFQICADDWGITPNIRFESNVESMEVVGKESDLNRYYDLHVCPRHYARKQTQGGGALEHQLGGSKDARDANNSYTYQGDPIKGKPPYNINVSSICIFPGNLCFPRPVHYKGEETFGGLIDFGVEMRCDYNQVTKKVVTIHGHGAFTMENIRTCLEYGVKHIYVLCRKINCTCPRVISWMINAANPWVPAAHCFRMLERPYALLDLNPWDLHSVHANAKRTSVQMTQKTRFGIGDVYFLAGAYGLMTLVVDNVKRCSHRTIHLESGRNLECDVIIKCTGCLGDWKVDRLMKAKQVTGHWVNADCRRCVTSDADGIDASNFGGTTVGPGVGGMVKQMLFHIFCPAAWKLMVDEGVVNMLPVHKAGEPNEEFPAYMLGARHVKTTAIMVTAVHLHLQEQEQQGGSDYKEYIQLLCAPKERIIRDAKEDWERYEKMFRDKEMVPADAPYVPYLYDVPWIDEQFAIINELNGKGDDSGSKVNAIMDEDAEIEETAPGTPGSRLQCTFTCLASEETITMPYERGTKVVELRAHLARTIGVADASQLVFISKANNQHRVLSNLDNPAKEMLVKGVKTFKPKDEIFEHPIGIIGAGYNGIKTAMFLGEAGRSDYIIWDRYDRVGGHCWLEMANKTTRLQTEFPTYHVWYGSEFSNIGIKKCGGAPTEWEIWPTCDRLLEHFQLCVQDYGILPNIRFETNVESMQVIGDIEDHDRSYKLTCAPRKYKRKERQGGGALDHQLGGKDDKRDDKNSYHYQGDPIDGKPPYDCHVCSIVMWPGNLCFPRPVFYPGEETFEGMIDFGVEMRCDYSQVTKKVVTIHGHGAFTMENIRTCLEYGVKKIFLLCRKMNLTCPRVCSWFANMSEPPMTVPHMLDMLDKAYKPHLNMSTWDMHSVKAPASRKTASIVQKTRFGIGDVYFLAIAYNLMEIVVDGVKRVSQKTLHLTSGRNLETDVIIKCTGCLGDFKVDKLLQVKAMHGYWVNCDPRRTVIADPDGVHASKITATTIGPGSYSWCKVVLNFIRYPYDWQDMKDNGILEMLPVHRAGEPNEEYPAYMLTANHSTGTGILVGASSAILMEGSKHEMQYKNFIQLHCCPTERILREAKADWEHYEALFRQKEMVPADAPYVPYLYDKDYVDEQFRRWKKETSTSDP